MGRTKRRRSSATLDTKVYKHPAQPMVPSHVLERAAKRHLAKVEPLLMKLRAEACQEALIELEDSPSPGGKSYRAMHAQYFSEKRKQFYTRYRGYI